MATEQSHPERSRVRITTQWVALIIAVATLLGLLVAGVRWSVKQDFTTIIGTTDSLRADINRIDARISGIDQKIDNLLNKALDRAFAQATASKSRTPRSDGPRGALEFGNTVMQWAGDIGVHLDGKLVSNFGLQEIAFAADPKLRELAWHGIGLSLKQRTLQNDVQEFVSSRQWEENTHDVMKIPYFRRRFHGVKMYETLERVQIDRCWLTTLIGSERQVRTLALNAGECSEYLLLVGGEVPALDDNHFRNVIFRDVHIVYRGGPLKLENVTFVNCSFDLKEKPPAATLAAKVLTSKEVVFANSGQ